MFHEVCNWIIGACCSFWLCAGITMAATGQVPPQLANLHVPHVSITITVS